MNFQIFALCIVFLLSQTNKLFAQSNAQPLGVQVTPVSAGIEAPAIVQTKFTSSYPNTQVSWRKTGENIYCAEFEDPATRQKMLVTYDAFGNILTTDRVVTAKKAPKSIVTYIQQNYPDTSLNVWSSEPKNGEHTYYLINGKDTVFFDKIGNIKKKSTH